jgi:hypothetical protein
MDLFKSWLPISFFFTLIKAFVLGVRDCSVESLNTILVILRLKLTYCEDFM